MTEAILVLLVIYTAVSLITVCLLAWDKIAAKRHARRIPEARIHWFEAFGGWPGSLIGQQILRHKRRKASFYRVTWLIAGAHLVVLGVVFACVTLL